MKTNPRYKTRKISEGNNLNLQCAQAFAFVLIVFSIKQCVYKKDSKKKTFKEPVYQKYIIFKHQLTLFALALYFSQYLERSTPRGHNIMALVDTECFMIYYDNFIGIFNKSTAAKGQKK